MPLVRASTYRAPVWLRAGAPWSGHAQTIFPAVFRRIHFPPSYCERLELSDGDFLDLAWWKCPTGQRSQTGQRKIAILTHGLEGSVDAGYVRGMARVLTQTGHDVLAWNFRGCGAEQNRLLRFYHSGDTADLAAVIAHATGQFPDCEIDLLGFSLGGNLTLKYLGESPCDVPREIRKAVVFSAPCDLKSSATQLAARGNQLYMRRFLTTLENKLRAKAKAFPAALDLTGLEKIRDFHEFDDRFTAPLHGFLNADNYYERSSSRQFLPNIPIPTLLVNAMNDPFLAAECYPFAEAEKSENLFLETPAQGGHVGFPTTTGRYWSEERAVEFLTADRSV